VADAEAKGVGASDTGHQPDCSAPKGWVSGVKAYLLPGTLPSTPLT
jgi:hypothetical protein